MELGFQGGGKWEESEGAQRYRRGLYIQFLRTTPYPLMVTFDAPDSMRSCSRRERSTTPLQALNLLNDPVFFEAAQVLAVKVLREHHGSTNSRLDYAFETVLGRPPKQSEKERLRALYQEQKRILDQNGAAAKVFPAAHLEGIDQLEAAAWVGVSRVLLNLEEFITRG